MNFRSVIKRDENMDKVFEELQSEMAEAFDESLDLEDLPPSQEDSAPEEIFAGDQVDLEPEPGQEFLSEELDQEFLAQELGQEVPSEMAPEVPEPARRLTAHTQNRLAALESFDKLYRDAQEHLQEVNAKLSEVTTSHHLTRQFFNILHADIQRANELELANLSLTSEQTRLSDRLQEVSRVLQERETALETRQQREASLIQDNEVVRTALSAAKLELVEAANTIARNEAEIGDLVKTLSTRTVDAERRARENEMLREKQVSLSIDLDKALNREGEARRKLDEITVIHANEAVRHAEVLGSLGKSEKELLRMQIVLENLHLKQSEMGEAARIMEAERDAEIARNLAEMRGLRSEIQGLQSRMDQAVQQHSDGVNEVANLKIELSDALAEKQVAAEKLSELVKENESHKMHLSAASANFSQLSLEQASEQLQLDIQRQECEDLRAEVASLHTRIEELLPYERHYRVTKARQPEGLNGSVDVPVVAATTTRAARRAAASTRRRAAV